VPTLSIQVYGAVLCSAEERLKCHAVVLLIPSFFFPQELFISASMDIYTPLKHTFSKSFLYGLVMYRSYMKLACFVSSIYVFSPELTSICIRISFYSRDILIGIRGGSVGVSTRLDWTTEECASLSGGNILFFETSRLALGPIGCRGSWLGVKLMGFRADRLPPWNTYFLLGCTALWENWPPKLQEPIFIYPMPSVVIFRRVCKIAKSD
jgi:hypothetical protein